jgi:hypothetical protein
MAQNDRREMGQLGHFSDDNQIDGQEEEEGEDGLGNGQQVEIVELVELAAQHPVGWTGRLGTEKVKAVWVLVDGGGPGGWQTQQHAGNQGESLHKDGDWK